jgi:two-component system chemotaxis response regulator CheY
MAKKKQYDLIITDQKMPGDVDGLTVIRTLKSMPEYRNTPIVMLTMETTEAMKNAARSVGATGWMNKPFTPVSLITMVQKVLR